MLSYNNPGVLTVLLTVKPALQTGGTESERQQHGGSYTNMLLGCILGNEGSGVIGDRSKLETEIKHMWASCFYFDHLFSSVPCEFSNFMEARC